MTGFLHISGEFFSRFDDSLSARFSLFPNTLMSGAYAGANSRRLRLLSVPDLKPANILLKSNMRDPRGFSAKVRQEAAAAALPLPRYQAAVRC